MFLEHATHNTSPAYLEETIHDIEHALDAPSFNEEDRLEVEASRAYFQQRYDRLMALADHSIKSAKFVA